mmetsp:Transcript_18483/g.25618  ORF Transcript_18483/g.25618 Transcript_18483/m.25618 type:complete len:215 (+) Transcript_18483:216-860(+)
MRPVVFLVTLLLLLHHGADAALRGQTREKKNKHRRLNNGVGLRPRAMQRIFNGAAWDQPPVLTEPAPGNPNFGIKEPAFPNDDVTCEILVEVTCRNLEGGDEHACGEIGHNVFYGADGINALMTIKVTNLSPTNNVSLKGVATIGHLVSHTDPMLEQYRDAVVLKNDVLEVNIPFMYEAVLGVLKQVVNVSAYVSGTELTCRDTDKLSFSVVLK